MSALEHQNRAWMEKNEGNNEKEKKEVEKESKAWMKERKRDKGRQWQSFLLNET